MNVWATSGDQTELKPCIEKTQGASGLPEHESSLRSMCIDLIIVSFELYSEASYIADARIPSHTLVLLYCHV